jgi:hypothetical protein
MAMTDSEILWEHGPSEDGNLAAVNRLPFVQIEGVAWDEDVMQLRLIGELWIVRFHGWNRYEGDSHQTDEVMAILELKQVPQFTPTESYASLDPSSHFRGLGGRADYPYDLAESQGGGRSHGILPWIVEA